MRKGTFLIVNEPNDETVDRELKVASENCDVFPALVYIPKFHKKMEKGLFCILTIFAQIAMYVLMAALFKIGYLALIPIEVLFLTMYAKEHVAVLRIQMVYLSIQLAFGTFITIVAFFPESGTYEDLGFFLPSLDKKTMGLVGAFFGMLTILRILLVASYHTHLFYSNLRDKFKDGKVILQPA